MIEEDKAPFRKDFDNDEVTLKDLILKIGLWIKFLLKNWLFIISIAALGGLLGLGYSFIKKSEYTAIATFVLEDGESGGGGLGQYAGLASMVGIDLGGGGGGIFKGDNILELYKSRKMIVETLFTPIQVGENKTLMGRYVEFNKLKESWSSNPKLKNLNFDVSGDSIFNRSQDSIISRTVDEINKNNLTVSRPDKKLSIIKVEFKSSDEIFAKVFTEQIVKNVNDFYRQTKTKKSIENISILQQKTDSVRAVMNGAIFQAASISDATPNLNPTRQAQRTAPIQKSQFTAETNKEILVELVKNLELSKISLRKEAPLIQLIDEPIYPLKREKLGKAKGLIYGGFIFGFLSVLFLTISLFIKNTFGEKQ